MKWIATCPHETVGVLASELTGLGIGDQSILHRGIAFTADLETAYRAHLLLRTASRIQLVVREFEVSGIGDFRQELSKIAWKEWLRPVRPFTVAPALTDKKSQELGEEEVIQSVAKSISGSSFEKSAPRFDPMADNAITIVVFVRNGSCVIGIDTAGRALHKRGWRLNGHPAVLKETLAASILLLAGYNGSKALLDPMCGSGTIAIEAAYIALNKAPLIHRGKDDFAFEHMAGFDRPLWRRVSDELRASRRSSLTAPIYASDINAKYVELARASALRARVEKYIEFAVKPVQEWLPPAPEGLMIANLPYGERIGKTSSGGIDPLYKDVGRVINEQFQAWHIALLVPADSPIHLLRLKEHRELALLNGSLSVKLLLA
ncbi:MAG: hypothetical protein ABSG94_04050 [Brevinematales bacterium]|jgi:putative N6-adenine-specific DNA methylase